MKVATALCALFLATAAQAADFKVLSDADEATSSPALITIKGRIAQGDEAIFRQTLGTIQSAIVFLESPGGSLTAAINIGLTIRKKKLETAVADGAICASACAIAWLGGSPRRKAEDARIGFHEPLDPHTKESSLKGDALIRDYIRQLGLPYAALTFIMRAGPKSMSWLTDASSSAYRIYYVELRTDQAVRYHEVLGRHANGPSTHDTSDGGHFGHADARTAAIPAVTLEPDPFRIRWIAECQRTLDDVRRLDDEYRGYQGDQLEKERLRTSAAAQRHKFYSMWNCLQVVHLLKIALPLQDHPDYTWLLKLKNYPLWLPRDGAPGCGRLRAKAQVLAHPFIARGEGPHWRFMAAMKAASNYRICVAREKVVGTEVNR